MQRGWGILLFGFGGRPIDNRGREPAPLVEIHVSFRSADALRVRERRVVGEAFATRKRPEEPRAPGNRLPKQVPDNVALIALAQARRFALQAAEVIKLRSANAPAAHEVNVVNYRRLHRKDTLNAVPEADLPNGNGLAHSRVLARNHSAFKSLQALFVAFPDLDVHANGVAWTDLRVGTRARVLADEFRHQCVLHIRSLISFPFGLAGQGVVRHGLLAAEQVGPKPPGLGKRRRLAPLPDLCVVASEKYVRHLPTPEVRRPCVLRAIQ